MPVNLEIVSPEKLLLSRPVDMVVIPASEGDMGVLEGHAPMIVMLRGGLISLYEGDRVTDTLFRGSLARFERSLPGFVAPPRRFASARATLRSSRPPSPRFRTSGTLEPTPARDTRSPGCLVSAPAWRFHPPVRAFPSHVSALPSRRSARPELGSRHPARCSDRTSRGKGRISPPFPAITAPSRSTRW